MPSVATEGVARVLPSAGDGDRCRCDRINGQSAASIFADHCIEGCGIGTVGVENDAVAASGGEVAWLEVTATAAGKAALCQRRAVGLFQVRIEVAISGRREGQTGDRQTITLASLSGEAVLGLAARTQADRRGCTIHRQAASQVTLDLHTHAAFVQAFGVDKDRVGAGLRERDAHTAIGRAGGHTGIGDVAVGVAGLVKGGVVGAGGAGVAVVQGVAGQHQTDGLAGGASEGVACVLPSAGDGGCGGCGGIDGQGTPAVFAEDGRESGRIGRIGVELNLVNTRRHKMLRVQIATVAGDEVAVHQQLTIGGFEPAVQKPICGWREGQTRHRQAITFACLGGEGIARIAPRFKVHGRATTVHRQAAQQVVHQGEGHAAFVRRGGAEHEGVGAAGHAAWQAFSEINHFGVADSKALNRAAVGCVNDHIHILGKAARGAHKVQQLRGAALEQHQGFFTRSGGGDG